MMQRVDIPFGEWLPSAPDYKNPGCLVADNVIPTPGGYGPQAGLVPQNIVDDGDPGVALAGAARGGALFFAGDNTAIVTGATATTLFKIAGGIATVTGSLTSVASGESVDFAQFNNIVVSTTSSRAPYYLDNIETDDTWSLLTGSPPTASYCARVEDFLMLGNIASFPNRIQWSAFNSPASAWASDRLTQAGFADLPLVSGAVQRVVGGRYPMVFQERGVSRLEYIGPPVTWRATDIELARGALAPFSVVTVGSITYFLAQDGFWATDGSSFQPIGSQRVNRWFFETVEPGAITQVHAAVDWGAECVVWAFRGLGSNTFNRLIRYSWAENRWSSATVTVSRLLDASSDGLTLEQIGALYDGLEDVPVSLDDARWKAKFRVLAAFVDGASTTDLNTFAGLPLAAQIETGEFQPIPGNRVFASGARVLGDGAQNWQVASVSYANDRSETYSAYTAPGVAGWSPLRADAQTMRLACRAAAGAEWGKVQGVQPTFRASGRR